MELAYIQGKKFDKIDFGQTPLAKGEYEACTFQNCDFANSTLAGIQFSDCSFLACNLSMTNISKTSFRDVTFKDCKMLGLHFETCNEFGFALSFDTCLLDHSVFYKRKLKKTTFKNSTLKEVDFAECDLSQATFVNCDLKGATFDNTLLEKADFRSSFHYSIDPSTNRIKKAKFSWPGVAGLLEKYDIEIEN
jgi:uncharacterized protein YjbI with pentapeptide repeats